MVVNCAWCATDAHRRLWAFFAAIGRPVSHGICDDCIHKLDGEDDRMRMEPIARTPIVGSSNIVAIGYDPPSQTLAVEFKGGAVYHYGNVGVPMHDALMRAESKGKVLDQMKKAFDEGTGDLCYPVKKMAVVPLAADAGDPGGV